MRFFILLCLFNFSACSVNQSSPITEQPFTPSPEFSSYWYQGQAEITRYELTQARYGELRKGNAILVFVTEDFLTEKQVKLENYTPDSKAHAIPVLKLNFVSNFNTGIYSYSPMVSVFMPLDTSRYRYPIKITGSVQEWCGLVYTQINHRNNKFDVQSYSYFEKEGDESYPLEPAWLEDALWTKGRLGPTALPTGRIRIIPGLTQSRFLHRHLDVESAEASLQELPDDHGQAGPIISYKIEYKSYDRTLIINFKKSWPHEITSFEGIYMDGFGEKAKKLHSIGIRTHTIKTNYWTKNTNADSTYRELLGFK
ncbi:MAG TPA: hypothetical protein PKO47_09570 [bacterium]|nr:hypothetical protein [bacterium]HNL27026.1 hypothetical protein [bacterium]